jgi:hypothetical protein
MRQIHCLAIFFLLALSATAQDARLPPVKQPHDTPELRTAKTVTLSPSYSCRAQEEFQKGYEGTALFLSDFAKRDNSPDLLFNGACGSEDYFQPVTHGGNNSFIADLDAGESSHAPILLDSFDKYDMLSRREFREAGFTDRVPVKMGHTYVVLIDKARARGVFVFTVMDYTPNKRVELSYEVKDYHTCPLAFDRIKPCPQQ